MPDQVRHDGEDDTWADALAAFRQAQAAVQAIEAATAGRSADEEEAWLPRHDDACERLDDALARAIAAPSPDLAAFAVKVALLFRHCLEPGALEEDIVEAVLADSRRLALGDPRSAVQPSRN